MNPRDAEKLLGGYATGTLDEAERKALFAAALEDQTLFDALADEEALRELLADPTARERLLAALTPAKAIPFWRRPGTMALAASLVAAVGVGILLKHVNPAEAPPPLETPRALPEAPAPKSAPPEAHKKAPMRPSPRLAKKAEPPPPPSPPPPPAASAGASAPDVTSSTQGLNVSVEALAKVESQNARQPRDFSSMALFAPGVVDAGRDTEWAWGPEDPHRLTVQWNPRGHLVLLSRDASGAHVVEPQSTSLQADGRMRSLFAPDPAVATLDLYWLPEAPDSPAALPAEGPINGFRARVRPTSPTR